jgi:hypothetical protein
LFNELIEYLPSGSDNEGDLGLGVNVEVAGLLGSALGINNGLVGVLVLLGVLGGVGSGDLSGLSAGLLLGGTVVGKGLEELSVSLLLLEDVLGDGLCPKTNNTVISMLLVSYAGHRGEPAGC